MYKLLIFDMDGTILNTLEDLADATNYALSENNLPGRSIDEIRFFVGNGIGKLIERAVPEGTDKALTEKVFSTFMPYYSEHCADKTRAYDGVCDVISEVRKCGYLTAVVSNKADPAVQTLCKDYFPDMFDYAVGEKEGARRKPYPDSVYDVLEKLGIEKKDAVYIGDSDVDVQTARNSGLDVIGVSWGFRGRKLLESYGADCIIDKPEELLDKI
jgi:phosphoglycolate phosphatase